MTISTPVGKTLDDAGSKNETISCSPSSCPLGLAGVRGPLFGEPPSFVNPKLPPGHTSLTETLSFRNMLWSVLTLQHFFCSPTLIWFGIAVFMHSFAPYVYHLNTESSERESSRFRGEGGSVFQTVVWAPGSSTNTFFGDGGSSSARAAPVALPPFLPTLLTRFAFAWTVYFLYVGFFFVNLYVLPRAQRKFSPNSFPNLTNIFHDLYYWTLGVLQAAVWESIMARLWAKGVLPYASNEQLFGAATAVGGTVWEWCGSFGATSTRNVGVGQILIQDDSAATAATGGGIYGPDLPLLLFNLFWIFFLPIWSDLHFYFAHRMLHIRCLYKYVHSLHHRDYDPEPFSGQCMHPVEHLYYFSASLLPTLFVPLLLPDFLPPLSPLLFQYNFVLLVISTTGGHSGFEDHWQSKQYHYLHHAKFECNYGDHFTAWIDMYMGTFREKLGESREYAGEWAEEKEQPILSVMKNSRPWSEHGYLGLQKDSHLCYTLGCLALIGFLTVFALQPDRFSSDTDMMSTSMWCFYLVPTLVAYGPILFAFFLCRAVGDRLSWRWPFHRERIAGSFGVFVGLGWLCCVLPVYYFAQVAVRGLILT